MNTCELTASVTATANAIACKLDEDELALLAAVLVQLGDTLATIATQRAIYDNNANSVHTDNDERRAEADPINTSPDCRLLSPSGDIIFIYSFVAYFYRLSIAIFLIS